MVKVDLIHRARPDAAREASKAGAQMQSKRKKKRPNGGPRRLALLIIAVTACALYLTGGLRVTRPRRENADAISSSVAALTAMEQRPLPEIRPDTPAGPTVQVLDEAAEQAKILAMESGDVTAAQLQSWYRDAALVGDSLADDARGYNWLSDAVIAKIGARALVDSPLLDDVEARQPAVIFLTFGMNDVEVYGGKVDIFTSRYRAVIERLMASCPDSAIYVETVFPVTDRVRANKPNYQYVDLYNTELAALCEELGVPLLDASFILVQRPELYEQDGIHMKRSGYPLWLTYLADEAGISYYDEQ